MKCRGRRGQVAAGRCAAGGHRPSLPHWVSGAPSLPSPVLPELGSPTVPACLRLHTDAPCRSFSALLCFTDTAVFFFNKWKVCGKPASSKSIGAVFPTGFAPSVSLCHVLAIFAIFQAFSLFYLL